MRRSRAVRVVEQPDLRRPHNQDAHGAILSNGGYHNPLVAPSLDSLARTWADVAQLVTAQVNRIVEDPNGLVATEPESQITLFYMSSSGWAEEARAAATTSLIGLAGAGQTDTGTPDLLAWRKAIEAGAALDKNLAILAVVSAHTLARQGRKAPPALDEFQRRIMLQFPIATEPVDYGARLDNVVDLLGGPIDDAAPAMLRTTSRRNGTTTHQHAMCRPLTIRGCILPRPILDKL